MKRWAMILVALFVLVLSACSSNPQQAAEPTNPNWNKVLFVGGKGTDAFIIQRLKNMGMDVTVKTDNEVTTEHAKDKGLIYISYTAAKGKIGSKFLNLDIPIIHSNSKSAIIHKLVKDDDATGSYVHGNGLTAIQITDEKHPIAAGLSGMVEAFTKKSNSSYIKPEVEGAIIVASAPDDPAQGMIVAYEKGTPDVDGQPKLAREVFYYAFESSETNITEDGWKLFEAMVEWAVGKR